MPLPIPRILSHSLAACDAETCESLRLFEELVARIEPAVKGEIRFARDAALEFPQLVASYLFSSLQRIRVTSWGAITALNAPNELLFVMAIRSMMESAANVAYIRANMMKTYAGEMQRREMTYLALRMKFATRKPEDARYDEEEAKLVASVNVLTCLKTLDRFAHAEIGFMQQSAMTSWYERLCEFSHPNCLGNSIGSKLNFPAGCETFDVEPGIRGEILGLFSNYLYVSLYAFCLIYNGCWRMLVDASEVLPTWEPAGDPAIELDSY